MIPSLESLPLSSYHVQKGRRRETPTGPTSFSMWVLARPLLFFFGEMGRAVSPVYHTQTVSLHSSLMHARVEISRQARLRSSRFPLSSLRDQVLSLSLIEKSTRSAEVKVRSMRRMKLDKEEYTRQSKRVELLSRELYCYIKIQSKSLVPRYHACDERDEMKSPFLRMMRKKFIGFSFALRTTKDAL